MMVLIWKARRVTVFIARPNEVKALAQRYTQVDWAARVPA